VNTGNLFTKTIMTTTTFTITGTPASGLVSSFMLQLINGGSQTINWWSGVKWPSATAPGLSVSGTDVLSFYTINGGTTWFGFLIGKGMA
jgi:hypothetical protein